METDDKTLVERILKGETDEFRHLMRRHGGTLLAFIEGIAHSREEAEDILQEAFVCAYRSLHQYNSQTASFATWLHHIAYHQALRQRKKRRLPAFSWDEDERLLATATARDTNEEAIEATEISTSLQETSRRMESLRKQHESQDANTLNLKEVHPSIADNTSLLAMQKMIQNMNNFKRQYEP